MYQLPNNSNIDVRKFEQMLDYNNLTTSYKLYWFSGIFKEILEGNQVITFKKIVCRMISNVWYSLIEYRLNLGSMDQLYETVMYIHHNYNFDKYIKEEKLLDFLDSVQDKELEKRISKFYKYVPYRLLHPFFSDILVGMKDSLKNKKIVELSNIGDDIFYRIIEKENKIYVNEKWMEYIYKNQSIIDGWLNYKTIFFLQNKNPNVPAIPFKLGAPCQRDLRKAKSYWKKIIKITDINDIYTNNSFIKENFNRYGEISIDHFIPWSFVLHDELWNLVPTFKKINSSKSNKLPKLDLYLQEFCDIQYIAYTTIYKNNLNKKYLEDYLTINKEINFRNLISKEQFSKAIKKTITPLHQIAYNQGYDTWNNNL